MKPILKIQNTYSWLLTDNQSAKDLLWKALRVRELGYEHSRLYKQRIWDGFTDYFKKDSGRFLTGLLPEVKLALQHLKLDYEVLDEREKFEFAYEKIDSKFLSPWQPPNQPKFELYDYQVDLINQFIKQGRGIISAATGAGKAQPLDSLVYTPNGPIFMQDVKEGIVVCTPDGKTAKVIGVFPQGKKPIFEIRFKNGDTVQCCEDHLWLVEETSNEFKDKVVDTKYIKDNFKVEGKNKLAIKNSNAIYFEEKPLLIPPYLLGLILGNKGFRENRIIVDTNDQELVADIKQIIKDDYRLRWSGKYHYISKKTRGSNNFYLDEIRKLNLANRTKYEKFIPNKYKYNSVQNRIDLVKGLMDANGIVGKKNEIYLSTFSKKIALDFKEVVESLGFICTLKTIKSEKQHYHVVVYANQPDVLFNLQKKKEKCVIENKNFRRVIKKVKCIGEKDCQCILLDSSEHLYITNNCLITHNTEIMIGALKVLPKNCPTLILANKKSLVQQNYERLGEWGFENFGRLYDKYNQPNVITSATIQSLHKIEKLLPYIKVLIVDEVHEMMSDLPKKFYLKLKNASVRLAVSATWEKFGGKDKSQRLSVKGHFGSVLKTNSEVAENGVVKTALLQKRGTLSSSNCVFYNVNKPDLLYEVYIDAVTHGIANNWHFHEMVKDITDKLKGRTLIIVERIAHGDTLHSLIPNSIWIAGKDDLETRKEVIDKLSKSSKENVVGIATQGIFTAGINVKIHNLINAAGGQADHIIIQRMGRGLRTAGDKDTLNYIDFMFNINEYLMKHSNKRVKVLKKEGHSVEIKDYE